MSWEDTLRLGTSTWKTKPMTHHSSSKKLHEDSSKLIAHADFLYEKFESFDIELDIEIEAKHTAVIRYRKEFETLTLS
jgi:UV DNA damage repair endonuclease